MFLVLFNSVCVCVCVCVCVRACVRACVCVYVEVSKYRYVLTENKVPFSDYGKVQMKIYSLNSFPYCICLLIAHVELSEIRKKKK